jgi:hypothetical protein
MPEKILFFLFLISKLLSTPVKKKKVVVYLIWTAFKGEKREVVCEVNVPGVALMNQAVESQVSSPPSNLHASGYLTLSSQFFFSPFFL